MSELIFYPGVDNYTTFCRECGGDVTVAFEGPESNFGIRVLNPCRCDPTPPDGMLLILSKIAIFKVHQDEGGRRITMTERHIRQ